MPNLHLSVWTISSSQICMNFKSISFLKPVIEYLGWDPTWPEHRHWQKNMAPTVFSNSRAQMRNDSATTELCNHQEEDMQFHTKKLVSARHQICILMWMASTANTRSITKTYWALLLQNYCQMSSWIHKCHWHSCSLIQYGYEWTKEQQIYLIDLQILKRFLHGKGPIRQMYSLSANTTKWIATTMNNILPCLNWYFSDQHYLISQAVDEEPMSHTVSSCSNTVDRVDKIIAKLECKKWK